MLSSLFKSEIFQINVKNDPQMIEIKPQKYKTTKKNFKNESRHQLSATHLLQHWLSSRVGLLAQRTFVVA